MLVHAYLKVRKIVSTSSACFSPKGILGASPNLMKSNSFQRGKFDTVPLIFFEMAQPVLEPLFGEGSTTFWSLKLNGLITGLVENAYCNY